MSGPLNNLSKLFHAEMLSTDTILLFPQCHSNLYVLQVNLFSQYKTAYTHFAVPFPAPTRAGKRCGTGEQPLVS
jgi:hypothetical protein